MASYLLCLNAFDCSNQLNYNTTTLFVLSSFVLFLWTRFCSAVAWEHHPEPLLSFLQDGEIGHSLSVTTFSCVDCWLILRIFLLPSLLSTCICIVPKKESETKTGSSVLGGNMERKRVDSKLQIPPNSRF